LTFSVILAKLVFDLIGEPESSIFNRLYTPAPAPDPDPGFVGVTMLVTFYETINFSSLLTLGILVTSKLIHELKDLSYVDVNGAVVHTPSTTDTGNAIVVFIHVVL